MKKKKPTNRTSIIISLIALLIAFSSLYFQFLNVNHSLLYSTLDPKFDKEKNRINVPILFKNKGNQTEVILESFLMLEVRNDSNSYYKKISSSSSKEYPLVFSPGDTKIINMSGNFNEYLFGNYEISETEFIKYYPITQFDSLSLIVNIRYLTNSGVESQEAREIGTVFFDTEEKLKRMDYEPINLIKLSIRKNESTIVRHSLVPTRIHGNWQIDLNDSNSVNQNMDKLLFLQKFINDTSKFNIDTLLN